MRISQVETLRDSAGEYEMEIFDHTSPKRIIICSHGNGVRRWDGEKFFYAVAEHFSDDVVLLADQNQTVGEGCRLNSLQTMKDRVQQLIDYALQHYPDVSIVIMGHSMGCSVITQLDLAQVNKVVFISAAAGAPFKSLNIRYGLETISEDVDVKTSDGLIKIISPEYAESVRDIVWEVEYEKLLHRFKEVYAFESGDEEILGDERLSHREMQFKKYIIIPLAKHNFAGKPLEALLQEIDKII